MRKVYNKLIRDQVINSLSEREIPCKLHTATDSEFVTLLPRKLMEEVDEYLQSRDVMELADILDAVYELGKQHGINRKQLEELRAKKTSENGGFRLRLVLEHTDE